MDSRYPAETRIRVICKPVKAFLSYKAIVA